jgi:hypothetical protein
VKKLLLMTSLMGSCAFPGLGVREIVGPNSETVYEAKCNGTARTYGDCFQQASETCHGPYTVVDKSGDQSTLYTNGSLITIIKRQIFFVCK